jgi:hypothetical protein
MIALTGIVRFGCRYNSIYIPATIKPVANSSRSVPELSGKCCNTKYPSIGHGKLNSGAGLINTLCISTSPPPIFRPSSKFAFFARATRVVTVAIDAVKGVAVWSTSRLGGMYVSSKVNKRLTHLDTTATIPFVFWTRGQIASSVDKPPTFVLISLRQAVQSVVSSATCSKSLVSDFIVLLATVRLNSFEIVWSPIKVLVASVTDSLSKCFSVISLYVFGLKVGKYSYSSYCILHNMIISKLYSIYNKERRLSF